MYLDFPISNSEIIIVVVLREREKNAAELKHKQKNPLKSVMVLSINKHQFRVCIEPLSQPLPPLPFIDIKVYNLLIIEKMQNSHIATYPN